MIFETLHESSERGELMLVDGGFCHWHLRRDGQLTIREIISTKPGAGSRMLNRLRYTVGATSLFAKCPMDLPANAWYDKKGFQVERVETTKSGRELVCWRLNLDWQPSRNVGNHIELIYCANGNPRFMDIAINAGWLSGAQLPGSVAHRPYFVDQDYKNPVPWDQYLAAVEKHHPYMATVTDWETHIPFETVMQRAQDISQFVDVVIIIPKIPGTIDQIPETVNGKPVRLGYSVPTSYGSTPVELYEFGKRPVHLLGGDPSKQIELAKYLNVVSVDTNYHTKIALNYARYFAYNASLKWMGLNDAGLYTNGDAIYRAFEYSCQNVKQLWHRFFESHSVAELPAPDYQMKLAI